MHGTDNRPAALANASAYGGDGATSIDGAPHLKHASVRALYSEMIVRVLATAAESGETPRVLDLGAGEGSATLKFLALGARVTAVDSSATQLDALRRKCERFGDRLEVRCEDVSEVLRTTCEKYDIVVASSFLHHVPDYLGLLAQTVTLLAPRGQFFSFQDPLRYDSVGRLPKMFSDLAYLSWRLTKGDVVGGLGRRLRRRRGLYLADSMHDNAEYHATRNGVDQDAICQFLREQALECQIVSYFSTQSRLFQTLGSVLGVKNTFAVLARRRPAGGPFPFANAASCSGTQAST